MTPFPALTSREIRSRDGWECTSCQKSSFGSEKWLLEATHLDHERNSNYLDPENGDTKCRVCHLLQHMDLEDEHGVNKIANNIWNTGLCHFSVYEKHPELMKEHRVQLSELLSASGWNGRVHITETVRNMKELKQHVRRGMLKKNHQF